MGIIRVIYEGGDTAIYDYSLTRLAEILQKNDETIVKIELE